MKHDDLRRLDLPAEPASVGKARRFVRSTLRDWDLDEAAEIATLLVSELATNAVLHARTAYAVVVHRESGDVRVEVCDGSGVMPRQRLHSAAAATGRGVALVAQLASAWGTASAVDGFAKCVWFTLPSHTAPSPTGADAAWAGDWLDGL
ncbi:MAG: ATP-binding protein [Mycobacteriales bacterium]